MSTFFKYTIHGYHFKRILGDHPAVTLRLTNCENIPPMLFPRFPNCKVLFLDDCHHNFFSNWVDKKIFPNVESVYVNIHPKKHNLHDRFSVKKSETENVPTFYVVTDFKNFFKDNYSPVYALPRVAIITDAEYKSMVKKMEEN